MRSRHPLVIGHRGACGYAAENTLASAALAHTQGADLVELDVILSRDGQLVVCHDLHLDELTDVAAVFPGRQRTDGLTYVLDLDWAELQQLSVGPRRDGPGRRQFAVQPLASLDQHLAQLGSLNRASGRLVELYLEIKSPAWHGAAGHDLTAAVMACLERNGLNRENASVIIESFDPEEVRRLRTEFKTPLRLTQLLGENAWNEAPCDYDVLHSPVGLREIATYASAIAVNLERVLPVAPAPATLVADARACGLAVHAYTFRTDALPAGFSDANSALRFLFNDVGLDGLFTDQPHRVRAFLDSA